MCRLLLSLSRGELFSLYLSLCKDHGAALTETNQPRRTISKLSARPGAPTAAAQETLLCMLDAVFVNTQSSSCDFGSFLFVRFDLVAFDFVLCLWR